MSSQIDYYGEDEEELREAIEAIEKKKKESDKKERELDQRKIRDRSRTPTDDIITKYMPEVQAEWEEHEERRKENPSLSRLWKMPLPNKSREYSHTPYTLNPRKSEFTQYQPPNQSRKKQTHNEYGVNGTNSRTTRRGGVKTRMTKKGKGKGKNKKKKKQRRRTNKKRSKLRPKRKV